MKQYPVDDNRHSSLQPLPAIPGILDAMKRFPLVAFGENHQLQEIHDVLTALLFHPELPDRITDIVMEFGNALYQEIADRFILEGQAIDTAELQQIWRTTLGGSLYWDAPVYEQFFRHVRAINWMLPPAQRLRVLLGDPPLDLAKLHSLTDKNALIETMQRDAHYASVVEREVLQKGRRALLIAGSYHLLRGMHTNHDPHLPNAGTLLATWHPDLLFVIEPLLLSREDSQAKLINLAVWPRPALARLAGTRLGSQQRTYRIFNALAALYQEQADAVLYLGPRETLTASRPDPAIYLSGYREQLQQLSEFITRIMGNPVDLVQVGLHQAQAGPLFFRQQRPET